MNLSFQATFSARLMSLFTLFLTLVALNSKAQLASNSLPFFQPDTTLNTTRLVTASSLTGAITIGSGIGLYKAWYSQFDQSAFHLFDDWGEWKHVDKVGHAYTTYFQSEMIYKVARWTGLRKQQSLWAGVLYGVAVQSTVEVFDGFSDKWGFSIPDFASNLLGAGLFGAQQHVWDEQRIRLKFYSTLDRSYDNIIFTGANGAPISDLHSRLDDLYGPTVAQRFIKDYNAQTVWLSVNLNAFGVEFMPEWLAIAVGYGSDNMFGGFDNSWISSGAAIHYPVPRYSQVYLAPDIDWSKLKTKSPFVKTLFSILNITKLPTPSLEYNTQQGLIFHLLLL